MLLNLANDIVKVFIGRVTQNVMQWTRNTSSKPPEENDLDFVDDRYPQTQPPRALCRILDEQFHVVACQTALNVHEKLNFASYMINTLGWSYSLTRRTPRALSKWMNALNVETKLVVLCAFIHDNDFLWVWMDQFFEDGVSESEWYQHV